MIFVALAAGYATRLRPLTDNCPKPLLPVKGMPILDWLIDDLRATGRIDRYVVVANHRFIRNFEAWRAPDVELIDDGTTANENRLGAVRDFALAMDSLHLDDDILLAAGDNMLDFSLGRFLEYFAEKQASCVMRYYEPSAERLQKCGVLELGAGDRVLSMQEKPAAPPSHWCCPPFYIYTRADAKRVGEALAGGAGADAPGSFAAWLAQKSPLYAMEMPGRRFDIGDVASYEAVKRHFA